MSKVDELIRELCPDGVDAISLGEAESCGMVTMGRGKVISKQTLEESPGNYPVYSSSAAGTGEFGRYGEFMFEDERITWSIDGGGKFFYRPEHRYSVTNVSGWMTSDSTVLSLKFLYQSLISQWEREEFDYTRKAHPSVIREVYTIPLPPLEVQKEIVRILDQFAELDRELEQEIAGRTAQFDRLREDLLSDENYPPVPVGNLAARVSTGATPKASEARYYQGGDIPWLRTGEVNFGEIWETEKLITQTALDETNVSWIAENCVVVAISGATAGRVAVNKIPMTTNQHCCNMQIDPEMANYRFVFHALASSYEEMKAQGRGARGDLNISLIKGFPIPLPPLEVQEEIANKLDTFTEYVDNLKRERELRQKQYEYYRDQLLDFPVKE
ncbi:restriction endonuclease subunit S [Corynebacterium riegelii]|uniref:restriction endonuclease subunit S n=1 Tax=Corynebacterium riegelii TaxID=156976 RepID=UPI00254A6AB7|nr:restriction endonuclease subunit S [Corynebacterium riegelii]MDK7180809.1 restriction endonuclease subunit S [Corynebacterium riegelii]